MKTKFTLSIYVRFRKILMRDHFGLLGIGAKQNYTVKSSVLVAFTTDSRMRKLRFVSVVYFKVKWVKEF